MAVTVESTMGWAFLVARGRHRGYRSILVPDFLANSGERSLLNESISGDVHSAGPPQIRPLIAGSAGSITVVYRAHRMTPADLAEGGVDGSDGGLVTDEHGRPLDLLYGFVSRATGVAEAREDDLATAKRQVLDVYRRFLSDEAGFRTSTSRAYPVQVISEQAAPESRPAPAYRPAPAPAPSRARAPSIGGSPSRPADRAPARSGRRRLALILAAVAAVIGVLALGVGSVAWLRHSDGHATPRKCPLTSSDVGATCQISVEVAAPIADRGPFTVTFDRADGNGAKWTASVSDCAQPAPGKGCTVTVHATVPGNDQSKHTSTATIHDHNGTPVQTIPVEAYR
jgi:hypothetical protein